MGQHIGGLLQRWRHAYVSDFDPLHCLTRRTIGSQGHDARLMSEIVDIEKAVC